MNIPFFRPSIRKSDIARVARALASPWLTRGPAAAEFEHAFAKYVGAKCAISTSSGSMGLFASLLGLDVGPGDLVVVPSFNFTAAAEAVLFAGAIPLLIDCHPCTLAISAAEVHAAIHWARANMPRYRVAAIIPMHYAGVIADPLLDASFRAEGIKIVHDAAHCVPAFYDDPWRGADRPVGTLDDVACYSFTPTSASPAAKVG